jgi:taurine dioxygenase
MKPTFWRTAVSLTITPSGQACGAQITGVDLTVPLSPETVQEIRDAWLAHHVLSFPDQSMSDDDLERFSQYFGSYGHDPFFGPIEGREHIAAIRREADEQTPIFAESWHSDWSFQESPPIATCLLGIDIPPQGGDTLFANQHLAYEQMPPELKAKLEGRIGIHSAVLGYAPDGPFGEKDKANGRSMDIRPSAEAYETQQHPLIRNHPETGRAGIFGGAFIYIIGIEGMTDEESRPVLEELMAWQSRPEFVYRHAWQQNMLVMWDNRSVLHRATGGYEGYRRELHRVTINAAA